MGSLKKILFGKTTKEAVDPKSTEAYRKGFEAGQRFADKCGITWLATKIQTFGCRHKILFLCIVFGVVLTLLGLNIAHFIKAYSMSTEQSRKTISIERLDSIRKTTSNNPINEDHEQN